MWIPVPSNPMKPASQLTSELAATLPTSELYEFKASRTRTQGSAHTSYLKKARLTAVECKQQQSNHYSSQAQWRRKVITHCVRTLNCTEIQCNHKTHNHTRKRRLKFGLCTTTVQRQLPWNTLKINWILSVQWTVLFITLYCNRNPLAWQKALYTIFCLLTNKFCDSGFARFPLGTE